MKFIQEISSQRKELSKDERKLRNFGILIAIVLLLLSCLSWYKDTRLWMYLSPVAAILFIASFAMPKSLWIFYREWMTVSFVIGFFVSRIILILLFYVAFVPIGIILKLLRKDLLRVKKYHTDSYWIKKERISTDVKQYEKMF